MRRIHIDFSNSSILSCPKLAAEGHALKIHQNVHNFTDGHGHSLWHRVWSGTTLSVVVSCVVFFIFAKFHFAQVFLSSFLSWGLSKWSFLKVFLMYYVIMITHFRVVITAHFVEFVVDCSQRKKLDKNPHGIQKSFVRKADSLTPKLLVILHHLQTATSSFTPPPPPPCSIMLCFTNVFSAPNQLLAKRAHDLFATCNRDKNTEEGAIQIRNNSSENKQQPKQ